MKIAFVSTMNMDLYQYYGKRFLQEFSKHAKDDILLFNVFEGTYPEEVLTIGKNIINLPLLSLLHQKFIDYFKPLNEANGIKIKIFYENGIRKINIKEDFRFNAIRFSFKPFSIHHCLDYLPENITHLIWTDADLRCKKNFFVKDLFDFLPHDEHIMSYLGRENSYSECGFLGFNLRNKNTINYINRIVEIYSTGEIFSLEQWHDSYIWDHVRKEFENNNLHFKDISGRGKDKEHVYINTGLNEFFDHLKGPDRKKAGHSSEEDYKTGIIERIKI